MRYLSAAFIVLVLAGCGPQVPAETAHDFEWRAPADGGYAFIQTHDQLWVEPGTRIETTCWMVVLMRGEPNPGSSGFGTRYGSDDGVATFTIPDEPWTGGVNFRTVGGPVGCWLDYTPESPDK